MNTTDLQKIDAYWRASNYLAAVSYTHLTLPTT